VREALDLCLACKACKGECPVHVDMATYKAEFLAHYYEHHWRPRQAWAFGLIATWARLASLAPRAANFVTQTPLLRDAAKLAAGMPRDRRIPAFAPQTFRRWFRSRPPRPAAHRERVILWPDTFNEHFHPETLRAAVDVLEAAGFTVDVPTAGLCCGRPLYDYGLLGQARRRLETILAALRDDIALGVPIVGLEPSCVSVFRDELVNLLPEREDARRLRQQTVTLAELLTRAGALPHATIERRVLVHGHCHHKAVLGFDADRGLLDRLGARPTVLDSGCCGMAGSFGFERDHVEVSRAVGERVLLPAVRDASLDTIVVADGFSCREQIAQETGRRAIHLAELVRMAMQRGPHGPAGDLPERTCVVDHSAERLDWRLGVAVSAVLLCAAVFIRRRLTRCASRPA
jgi:Fe-S oxidoreductase